MNTFSPLWYIVGPGNKLGCVKVSTSNYIRAFQDYELGDVYKTCSPADVKRNRSKELKVARYIGFLLRREALEEKSSISLFAIQHFQDFPMTLWADEGRFESHGRTHCSAPSAASWLGLVADSRANHEVLQRQKSQPFAHKAFCSFFDDKLC